MLICIFLDIEFPGKNGMEVADLFGKMISMFDYFLTSYRESVEEVF